MFSETLKRAQKWLCDPIYTRTLGTINYFFGAEIFLAFVVCVCVLNIDTYVSLTCEILIRLAMTF